MVKSTVRIICFAIVLFLVLGGINDVLKFKFDDGIYDLKKFYELENNTIDVLVLGSSHAYCSYNTGTLWDEQGISSFVLGGSEQPLWNTYYYLKEALKTQHPALIILEGLTLSYTGEYKDDSRIIKNTYGLRWSLDKVNAIRASAPKDRLTEFLLDFSQYHTRYSALGPDDFKKNLGLRKYDDWKGFTDLTAISPYEKIDVSGITEESPLSEKTERYYRATIELAQEAGIPLLVAISPYAVLNESMQMLYNTGETIAAEYGVPFLHADAIYKGAGIDFTVDTADGSHLNIGGSQKFTSYIGRYVKEHYDIPDHRGDPAYDSWQRNADYIRQENKDFSLSGSLDLDEVTRLIQDPNYWVFMSVDGTCTTADARLQGLFSALGIDSGGDTGIWYRDADGIAWSSGEGAAEKYISTPAHDFCLRREIDDTGAVHNAIIMDRVPYSKTANGVNLVVYDVLTEQIAATKGIDISTDPCTIT